MEPPAAEFDEPLMPAIGPGLEAPAVPFGLHEPGEGPAPPLSMYDPIAEEAGLRLRHRRCRMSVNLARKSLEPKGTAIPSNGGRAEGKNKNKTVNHAQAGARAKFPSPARGC